MKKLRTFLTALVALSLTLSFARAEESVAELNELLNAATGWLQNYQADPQQAIPDVIIQNAEGVMYYKMVGGSFIIGAQSGEGFAMVRDGDGWSPPAFYSLSSGSFGAQVGGSEQTVMLFFMNKEGLKVLSKDGIDWAGTARATGGPSSAGDAQNWSKSNSADIYVYSTSSGLEASAAVKGINSEYDVESNNNYYKTDGLGRQSIFGGSVAMPAAGKAFVEALNRFAESD